MQSTSGHTEPREVDTGRPGLPGQLLHRDPRPYSPCTGGWPCYRERQPEKDAVTLALVFKESVRLFRDYLGEVPWPLPVSPNYFFFFYQILFIADSLEKLLSTSQLIIGNVMYIFRIVTKFGKTSIKFLSYISFKMSGHFNFSDVYKSVVIFMFSITF